MTLIKSISGIRGTIGGKAGENLTPIDVVKFTSAYADLIKQTTGKNNCKIVVGRDARISGSIVKSLVINTLLSAGCDVIDIDFATTPTTEMAVIKHKADGGIIITASHNPRQWNALKLLNHKGEFIDAEQGKKLLEITENESFDYSEVDELGKLTIDDSALDYHIDKIFELPYVNKEKIKNLNIKILADAINSVGALAISRLLDRLGLEYKIINDDLSGNFSHNPEPLEKNLLDTINTARKLKADVTFVVDPDVDRLAIIDENGNLIGEEYTLVTIADYILQKKKGNTVSNLSSSLALGDVSEKHGVKWHQSAVGEVNVVNKMKTVNAVIGGEGNGGVILPDLHYGRDAIVGIALFLSYMAESGKKVSAIRAMYPDYYMSKNKIQLSNPELISKILNEIEKRFANYEINKEDGVKIMLNKEWIHLRKSNTEPIIRIYTESTSQARANELANQIITIAEEILERIK
jgi:phosphomannomutase